ATVQTSTHRPWRHLAILLATAALAGPVAMAQGSPSEGGAHGGAAAREATLPPTDANPGAQPPIAVAAHPHPPPLLPAPLRLPPAPIALTLYGACHALDARSCLPPFPNDRFTVPDASTDTGRRVHLDLLSMPRNVAGKPIDPTDWNRNDGFSPSSPILTYVP